MGKALLTGSFQLMKSINRSVILNIIREQGPISRAEIAKVTKLTPPTVSNLVKELLQADIIVERSLGESSGGRKPTMLTLNSSVFHVIGLDIGSHHLTTILADISGKLLKKETTPIPAKVTNEGLLDIMAEAILSIKKSRKIDENKIVGIGVAMHGIVDVEEGVSIFAPNLNLKDVPVKEFLENRFNMLVKVENDARAMSLGEQWFGNGTGVDSLVCINVGRGVGAGIIINGKLFHGQNSISGEIGHMVIDVNGPKCTCGNFGCLQTFSSGPAIVELVARELRLGLESNLHDKINGDFSKLSGEMIYEAALKGDLLSQNILSQAGRYLGIGLTNLIHIVNPKRIIIGGGVSNAREYILVNVKHTIAQRALTESAKETEILVSKFGEDASVMGAVALILAELFAARGNE
ncbi:MarR family transcriptional regulator [Cytobacillus oceanisediminis]|uniref:MarR family transcriptional regulator n=1 Tax=Cytobacillus oceanisediminis TaxID=665099 RepID=A0A2V2ZV13_9BACI|nr:ROK family transcriptional regulator [Cytobacillus oceanisediminis]PWW28256.1 MarR family transcriptional regulator [Cytobacillus oceanisediminis]